ncbi:MAG: dihydrodipicolinate synthase family protein [Candidatus Paceibacterota bacterium]
MKKDFLNGLIAAPFTPMDKDGNINLNTISDYAEKLIDDGLIGAFICGTNGETTSLSVKEKKAVLEEWVSCAGGRLKIFTHVGGTLQSESIELAKHAEETGAYAIAAVPPYYLKPETAEDVLLYLKPIAEAASELPFYYYNIPSMTGVNIPVNNILANAKKVIPNLTGVKYSHSDFIDVQECIAQQDGNFQVIFGSDELLICGLTLGVTSAIGSTYNYMPQIYTELMAAFNEGNLEKARELQLYSVKVVNILNNYGGGVRAGKEIMNLLGIECGSCRPPIRKMEVEEKTAFQRDLSAIGFFEVAENEDGVNNEIFNEL